MQFAVFHSGGWVPQVRQAVTSCGMRWGAAVLKWHRVVCEMSSGPTEVPYFRWLIARCIFCSVTGLVLHPKYYRIGIRIQTRAGRYRKLVTRS